MIPMVNTKRVERRDVKLGTLTDLSTELDRIEAAHQADTLTTLGNWSPGQIFTHCAILMRCAIDGFPPGKPSLPARIFLKLVIKPIALKGGPPPAGIQLPEKAAFLIPPDDTSFEDGIAQLRGVLARVTTGGERFVQRSPVFGKLTHEQWIGVQLGHCSLHLGFLKLSPEG